MATGATRSIAAARALHLDVGLEHYPALAGWIDRAGEISTGPGGVHGRGGGTVHGGGVHDGGTSGDQVSEGGSGGDWGGSRGRAGVRSRRNGSGGGGRGVDRDVKPRSGVGARVGMIDRDVKPAVRAAIPEDEEYLGSGLKPGVAVQGASRGRGGYDAAPSSKRGGGRDVDLLGNHALGSNPLFGNLALASNPSNSDNELLDMDEDLFDEPEFNL